MDIKELYSFAWKPYPSKNQDESRAFELSNEQVSDLPAEKRNTINKIRADYVGKLITHRYTNFGNYVFLKNHQNIEGCDIIIATHEKDTNCDNLTINIVFKSLSYWGKE